MKLYTSGGIEIHKLEFANAVNHDEFGLLPVYRYVVPVYSVHVKANINILNEEYTMLFQDDFPYFEDNELVIRDVQTRGQVEVINKKPYFAIYLMPVRKEGNTIEGLSRFTIEIEIDIEDPGPSGERTSNFAEESVLKTGKWYRIATAETGIHKISYEDLSGMGLDVASLDPAHLRLYGNGNGMLPEPNSTERIDDLREIAIYISGGEDGSFDPQDYILFYGQGPTEWNYSSFYRLYFHENNIYTDKTYYFLNAGIQEGKRISQLAPYQGNHTHEVDHYDSYMVHEKDSINIIKSGKEWYGEEFNTQLTHEFAFHFEDLDLGRPVSMKINLAARSTEENSFFTVFAEGDEVMSEEVASVSLNSAVFARGLSPNPVEVMPGDELFTVRIDYGKPNLTSAGWLNYIELNATSKLIFRGGQLAFREDDFLSDTSVVRYNITSFREDPMLWDVTDIWNIASLPLEGSGQDLHFTYPAEELHEFILFDGSEFYRTEFIEELQNQNLHGYAPHNLVIISHPMFLDEAGRLAAHHETFDGMSTLIVTPQEIYNEFSSGAQDVTAIRDFLRMLYERSVPGQELRYVLFFGDGSYDYKDRLPGNTNLVPTFQSRESLKLASSFVTDDFFACFDINEGSNSAGNPDIGYGRFPVFTQEQAREAVDKVLHYSQRAAEVMGSWRNRITFIADDGDVNIHFKQAEDLTELVDTLKTVYDVNKIYLDSYEQLTTPGGNRYPEASEAIDRVVKEGALIVNYTGHGGELGWADERVLDIPMINLWQNSNNMPVFVTATCEFSRFDDPAHVSAGELVFLNPEGAGIGLYTTTRLAYAQSNFGLNEKFYLRAFDWDTVYDEPMRMGDLIKNAKNPANNNIRNFVLLGDPALMLAFPEKNAGTTKILDESLVEIDTLKALARVTVSGAVTDEEGNVMTGFNGMVNPVVYDKPVINRTLGNDQGSRVAEFLLQNKVLYRGTATVSNGEFNFTFVVPKDIGFAPGYGKITYYAYDTITFVDAHGYQKVMLGGIDENAQSDDTGPEIELFINHPGFESGDYTSDDPILFARFFDESGINTVSNGIGHDITLVLGDNFNNPVVLNDYYQAEPDSYQQGSLTYPLGKLPDGRYTLTVKAWDVYNNSSTQSIEFIIDYDSPIMLTNVINVPNPFRDRTRFTFYHNKPGLEMDVFIHIYNLSGQRVTTLEGSFTSEETEAGDLYWDGTDEGGEVLSSGLYIYRVIVRASNGYLSEQVNKLMIIR